MSTKFYQAFIQISAVLFVILFGYTAVNKILDLKNFTLTLAAMPSVGRYSEAVAYTIIGGECTAVFLLIIPATRFAGLWVSFCLMLGFTMYMSFAVLSDHSLPCSCGGVLKYMSWSKHLVFNVILLIIAILSIFAYLPNHFFKQAKVQRDVLSAARETPKTLSTK